jgi:hypothetical protein
MYYFVKVCVKNLPKKSFSKFSESINKSFCHQKWERVKKKQRKRNTDAHSQGTHADPNGIRAAWFSDLHQICHSNNSENKHTHTLWSFNWKWFTHNWINTSDHRMQILVPYIGLNNPETIFQAHNSNNIMRHWT